MSQLKYWCFTSYNLNAEFTEWESLPDAVTYLIYQEEICPETRKRHLQGYVEFDRSYRMQRVKQILGTYGVHLESRKGSSQDAADYCRKQDSRVEDGIQVELGTRSKTNQGHRSDLDSAARLLLGGGSISELMQEHPSTFVRYHRGFENMYFRVNKQSSKRWRDVRILVLWGDTGTGKTRTAIELAAIHGGGYYKLGQSDRLWLDGYEGERTLILDDFYGWIQHGTLLVMLDGHDWRGPTKGGHIWANWDRVVITSNKSPEEWYAFGLTPALERRITWTREMETGCDRTQIMSEVMIGFNGLSWSEERESESINE